MKRERACGMLEHIGAELSRSHAALRARARRRSAWIAHLQTCRPYTLAYPGLVGLAGAALAGQTVPVRLAAVWCAVTSGWLAGHYIGDFCDRDLDAIAKPQRPIPSGRLGPDEVLAAGVACAAGCVAAAALARPVAAAPAALIVAGIVSSADC